MSPSEIFAQYETLPAAILNLRASSYLSAAGMMVLIYDTMLTFPDEVRLIWPMPFGLIKCILLLRYFILGMVLLYNYQLFPARPALSDSFCQGYVVVCAWLINIVFAASNWLLLLRVSVLWGRKKAVIYPLYVCYGGLYITLSIILGLFSVNMWRHLAYNPFVNVCSFMERIPRALIHSQWLPIVFDLVMFALTLVKAEQDNLALRKGSRANAPLLFILFRDGGIYCIVIIALRIANFVAWAFLTESMVYLWSGFLFAIVAMLINRFYLNLRSVAYATAAALLTNASRPARAGARLREPVEGVPAHGLRGGPPPWEDDGLPVIDVIRQVDEAMMVKVERRRVQTMDSTYYNAMPHLGDLEEGMPSMSTPIDMTHSGGPP